VRFSLSTSNNKDSSSLWGRYSIAQSSRYPHQYPHLDPSLRDKSSVIAPSREPDQINYTDMSKFNNNHFHPIMNEVTVYRQFLSPLSGNAGGLVHPSCASQGSHSNIHFAAGQQVKRKSEEGLHGFATKKQKSVNNQQKQTSESCNNIQPVGAIKGQEPLTHVERWRMQTWVWPKK
jgi:hypothetical protein